MVLKARGQHQQNCQQDKRSQYRPVALAGKAQNRMLHNSSSKQQDGERLSRSPDPLS